MVGECSICLNSLTDASATTLPCDHKFHRTCVDELRKFGVKQTCPLCRTPLPPGPEKVFEEATLRFMVICRLVESGGGSWSALPASAQEEVNAAIAGWHEAAKAGLASAQHNLGMMYEGGRGVAQSDAESAKWFKLAAEQGHAPAECYLGIMFDEGRGVERSDAEAMQWYTKSAEKGFAQAQFYLGNMYESGRGVAKDDVAAAQW